MPLRDDAPPNALQARAETSATGAYVLRRQVPAVDGYITRGELPFAVAPGAVASGAARAAFPFLNTARAKCHGSTWGTTVPSEVRHLLFRPAEVVQAVMDYRRRSGAPLPSGAVARCGPEAEGAGVRFRITLVPDRAADRAPSSLADHAQYDVVVEGPALAAALILHCRTRDIPLSASAEKSLQRFGERVCLVSTINAEVGRSAASRSDSVVGRGHS